MSRRILTAREQHEMLSPWRTAGAARHVDLDEALRSHGIDISGLPSTGRDVSRLTASLFLLASGYYDPVREDREFHENLRRKMENDKLRGVNDFVMTHDNPFDPRSEDFGTDIKDRLVRHLQGNRTNRSTPGTSS